MVDYPPSSFGSSSGPEFGIYQSLHRYLDLSQVLGDFHVSLKPGEYLIGEDVWEAVDHFRWDRESKPRTQTEQWWFHDVLRLSRRPGVGSPEEREILTRLSDPNGGLDFIWGMKFEHQFQEELCRHAGFRRVGPIENLAGQILVAPKVMVEYVMEQVALSTCQSKNWSAVGSEANPLDGYELGVVEEQTRIRESYTQVTMTLPMPRGDLSLERLMDFRQEHARELETFRQTLNNGLRELVAENPSFGFSDFQARMEMSLEPIREAIESERTKSTSSWKTTSGSGRAVAATRLVVNYLGQVANQSAINLATSGETDPKKVALELLASNSLESTSRWLASLKRRGSASSFAKQNFAYVYQAARVSAG